MLAMTTVAVGSAVGGAQAAMPKNKQKVVYHLSDAEKVQFVLSNI